MKIVKPYHIIETPINGEEVIRHIEKCARTCYKSEHKIGDFENAKKLVANVIKRGHESTIEHFNITVRFLTNRGVTHELVRHRIASFSQESTRYCSYDNNNFGNQITVIEPFPENSEIIDEQAYIAWRESCLKAEESYMTMLKVGYPPQIARSVLPNCLATEIVVTANLREWRKIFQLRTVKDAHPEMRALMIPLLNELKGKIPVIFDDI